MIRIRNRSLQHVANALEFVAPWSAWDIASDAPPFMTGQTLVADGAFSPVESTNGQQRIKERRHNKEFGEKE